MDKTEDAAKNGDNNNTNNTNDKNGSHTTNNSNNTTTDKNKTVAAEPDIKTYQNYDFVPGDKVLFEDNFADDRDGEFPSHWELRAGQGVLNKLNGELVMKLTEGNYARVKPRMKTEVYLTDPFTLEYDMYFIPGAYGLMSFLMYNDKQAGFEKEASVQVSNSEVSFNGQVSFSKALPKELSYENFDNKWHHIAIAFKNKQMKVYVDQFRVLLVPDTKEVYDKVELGGIGAEDHPMVFKNVRIAAGGDMNMIGKKFTESKIVTHGINFDIDKSTIKPESMGTLNMIVQVMKDNPDIKFQVGGHTDNSGTAAHNLTLSQQRADAVKDQLLKMGIDASRLTAKGFGDTKPISDNSTLEGKANNRRVEFVKM